MKVIKLFFVFSLVLVSFSCSKKDDAFGTVNNIETPKAKLIEIEALELINAYRIKSGLSALKNNETVKGQAYSHSDYMVKNNNLSHDNFYRRSVYLTHHEGAELVTENVAYGYTKAETLVKAWIRSEKHRKNMLGDYTHFEISAEQDTEGKWYYTNIFMKK